MLPEELVRFLESGVSIHVATCDEQLEPHGARVWAVLVEDDRAHLTAFVHESDAPGLLHDLETNGQLALGFSRPTDHRSCQLKGSFAGSRAAVEADRPRLAEQGEKLLRELEGLGVPRALLAGARTWPCVALRVRVEEMYSQTPGPGAGERLV